MKWLDRGITIAIWATIGVSALAVVAQAYGFIVGSLMSSTPEIGARRQIADFFSFVVPHLGFVLSTGAIVLYLWHIRRARLLSVSLAVLIFFGTFPQTIFSYEGMIVTRAPTTAPSAPPK
jgi:hypothetical protein